MKEGIEEPDRKKPKLEVDRSFKMISPSASTVGLDTFASNTTSGASSFSNLSNILYNDNEDCTTEKDSEALRDWADKLSSRDARTRSRAFDTLYKTLDINQLRQLSEFLENRLKFDIVSNVPYEISSYIMSFLEPRDLCRAAQTCRYYRIVCEDNKIWREKCREDNLLDPGETFQDFFKKRIQRNFKASDHNAKATYFRLRSIVQNWRCRNFENNNNDELLQKLGSSNSPTIHNHLLRLPCHDEHVITCLQYNPVSELIVSGSDDNTLRVWSATNGKCLRILEGHDGGVWSSQLSPDNTVISGSTDRTIRVWDALTGESKCTFHGHTSTVRCLALNGDLVVSGSRDHTLRLWDIKSYECKHIFIGHCGAVRCVEYKDDIIVSGAYDNLVKVWNAETGLCMHSLEAHENRIYSLQFDGNIIASGSLDSNICIWSAKTGELKHTLIGHTSLTSKMQLSSNILATANADSYCRLWDVDTGKCLKILEGPNKHSSAITSVYFNSRFVVTSSDDGTVKLWNIKTGEFIRNLYVLPTACKGGVIWRIRASYTKLVCAAGSRNEIEETHLIVLDFDNNDDL